MWQKQLLYIFFVLTLQAAWSTEVLLPTQPGEPQQLHVVEVTSSSVKISWEPPVRQPWQNYSITGYQVSHNLESGLETVHRVSSNVFELAITGLEPDREYNLAVAAFNQWGVSLRTSHVQAFTLEEHEFDTTTVNVTALEHGTALLPCHVPSTALMYTSPTFFQARPFVTARQSKDSHLRRRTLLLRRSGFVECPPKARQDGAELGSI